MRAPLSETRRASQGTLKLASRKTLVLRACERPPMSQVVLFRLAEWPAAQHLLPLLHMLAVPSDALEVAFYFHPADATPITLPEVPRHPEAEPALLATAFTLACFGRGLVGLSERGRITGGFHWSATVEALAENARANGHDVLRIDEVLRVAEGQRSKPNDDDDLACFEVLLKHCAVSADRAPLRRFVHQGGTLPRVQSGPLGTQNMSAEPGQWGPLQERILDALVALAGPRSLPEVRVFPTPRTKPNASFPKFIQGASGIVDDAGRYAEMLKARGVSDARILEALTGNVMTHERVPLCDAAWESRWLILLGWYARFDDIASLDSGAFTRLFCAPVPDHYRPLLDLCLRHHIHEGLLHRLDLNALGQLRFAASSKSHEELAGQAHAAFSERVLASPAPSLVHLNALAEKGLATCSEAECERLRERAREAAARDASLADLDLAVHQQLLTDVEHAHHLPSAFARAVATGFYGSGEQAQYGDAQGFLRAAPKVAETHPDLVLQAIACLTERYNEHGISAGLADWDRVVPKRGFSSDVLAQLAEHFAKPEMRAAARLMKRFLEARGIVPKASALPRIEDVDITQHVGTDVGHLAIGSFIAIEKLAEAEDPADWPAIAKRLKCVAFETLGDGEYSVRVVHASRFTQSKGDTRIGVFPLEVKDQTLSVSGIVGAGGVPSIPFPDGRFAADLIQRTSAAFVLVLTCVEKLPRWAFGAALPKAND